MVPQSENAHFVRSYPGRTAFAPDVRADVRGFLVRSGVATLSTDDVILALGEVLIMALPPGAPRRPLRVGVTVHRDRVEVEAHCENATFGSNAAVTEAGAEEASPRGLGLHVIYQLVDRITFSDRGRTARFVKRLS